MHYAEDADIEMVSNFVTWESKDGQRYRFFQRKLKKRRGRRGGARRGGARRRGQGRQGRFYQAQPSTLELAPGVVFPTAHTILLIERAAAGEAFIAKKMFDGSSDDNAADVTAVIGAPQTAEAGAAEEPVKSPLLARPSWRMRLAFFPADATADDKPDYELGMRLLDNGVSRDMVLDYGDFAIKAKLDKIEALPKPSC